jgi:hypothetical protein
MDSELETAYGVIFMPLFPNEKSVKTAVNRSSPTSPAKAVSRYEPDVSPPSDPGRGPIFSWIGAGPAPTI